VGANSSGKSTLIQSLLALAQAAGVETDPGSFPLNGKLARLGTYEETKRFQSSSDQRIELGVELEGNEDNPDAFTFEGRPDDPPLPLRVRFQIELGESQNPASGQATISSLIAEISTLGEDENHIAGVAIDSLIPPVLGGRGARIYPTFQSESYLISAKGTMVEKGQDARAVDWVAMSGGVPLELFQNVTKFDYFFDEWWHRADILFSSPVGTVDRVKNRPGILMMREIDARIEHVERPSDRASMVSDATEQILRICSESIGSDLERFDGTNVRRQDFFELEKQFGKLDKQFGKLAEETFRTLSKAEWRDAVRLRLGDDSRVSETVVVRCDSAIMSAALKDLRHFFSSDVKYLGPIREAPHVLYSEGVARGDIGVSGEHTAAVLLTLGDVQIMVPTSDGAETQMSLGAGIDYWLKELGLGSEVRASDRGRLGIGLQVIPLNADHVVDLTSVGVGVSQLLPVIVLCLLAKPGQVVILEQPELHLHPLMQQKLADFLLVCTQSGRQIIVETHSEHLVNRLRRRAVEDSSNSTSALVGLLFAEQADGETRYRASAINSLGGLDADWPSGFLNVGSDEIHGLLQAALQKRRSLQDSSE
jgi:predicted ATPase